MSERKSDENLVSELVGKLRGAGEETFNQLAGQLLQNETFLSVMQQSLSAKQQVDTAVSGTMDFVNLPSKNDIGAIVERLDAISTRLARLEGKVDALSKSDD
jgi:hypothetical protein